MMRGLAVIFCAMLVAAPALAQTQRQGASQLAASIQKDLDFLGFEEVDAQSLSLRQLGALRSLSDDISFARYVQNRYEAQAILRTDGFTTFDGIRVDGTRRGRY
ncbi:MAG: hypothetical protein AAF366_09700 [Pseudomonadota bacterium]